MKLSCWNITLNDLNVMETKKIEPILKDERGLFFEVANKLEIRHIVVTTFNENSIRGNQFRKNMDQYFFLISGKAKLVTKSLNSSIKNETQLTQGSLVYIPRNTAFVTVAEKESVLLEFSPQEFDPNNPDINKFELID